jgi:hypothetical protein
MRVLVAMLAVGLAVAPGLARAQITCAQLPKAAAFVNTKLKPGPNTDAAKRHLVAAEHATSNAQCVAELRQVDYYAKRSMAADRHSGTAVRPRRAAPAHAAITCAQLPKAATFVNTKLKPGPNTDAAKRHLAAAEHAKSNAQCVAELRQVDYYAKRSLAADRVRHAHVRCGDVLHPTLPGGVDYHGPPVPGCRPVRF